MIVVEEPRNATTDVPDAEALIREARSRQRKRWLTVMAVMLAVALGVGLAVSASSGGTGSKPKPTASAPALSPQGILRLANKGLSGSFEATYKLTGNLGVFPGRVWTVVVAHRGLWEEKSVWMLGSGEWSFLLRAGGGYKLQWIEHANRYQACWQQGNTKKWSCGKGTVYAVNGFILSNLPYVPATVDGDIGTTVTDTRPLSQGEHQRLTVASKPSARFGKLNCLTSTTWFLRKSNGAPTDVSSVTWCLTAQGLPASEYQRGNQPASPWNSLTLVSTRRVAPRSHFQPMSSTAVRNAMPGLG